MKGSNYITLCLLLVCAVNCFNIEGILQNLVNQDYSQALAKAPSEEDDMFRFIVFGDFGRVNLYKNISKVAEAMNTLAQKDHYEFMTTVGDNFYPNGIRYSWFRLIPWVVMTNYKRSAIKDMPIYGTIGNHDCYSNYTNEIVFSNYDNQWTIPSDYYVKKDALKNEPDRYFVNLMLNSCKMFCPGAEWGGVAEECTDMHMEVGGQEVINQYAWLKEQLEIHTNDPTVSWVAVSLHHPPFVEMSLKKYFLPLLKKYKVDILFVGHDHWIEYANMEYEYQVRFPDDRRGPIIDDCTGSGRRELLRTDRHVTFRKGEKMHQLMSGGAGASLDDLCPISDQDGDVQYRLSQLGLMTVEVSSSQFNAIYYDEDATEVYRVTINQ